MALSHILCATDLSETSTYAVEMAAEMAASVGARLTIVHVIEPITMPPGLEAYALEGMPPDWEQRVDQGRRQAVEDRLAELRARCGGAAVTTQVIYGPLPTILTDAARDLQADLLVVGTHGRKGMAHLLLGSVAEKLVRTAPCPVLVVRPTAHR